MSTRWQRPSGLSRRAVLIRRRVSYAATGLGYGSVPMSPAPRPDRLNPCLSAAQLMIQPRARRCVCSRTSCSGGLIRHPSLSSWICLATETKSGVCGKPTPLFGRNPATSGSIACITRPQAVSRLSCYPSSMRLWSRSICKISALGQGRSRAGHLKLMRAAPPFLVGEIGTMASPWLAAAIGAVHRSQPVPDLENMAIVFVLALMTPDSQHTYMHEFERFQPGSLRLDRIIEESASKVSATLPEVIVHFLTACKEMGIPR